MNKKKGILILTLGFRPNIGGLETHLNDLCEYLCKRNKYQVFVITYQPLTTRVRAPRIEREENLEIHRIRRFGHNWFYKLAPFPLLEFLYLFPSLMMTSFLFLLKKRKRINVIHAQGLVCGVAGKLLAKLFKKRVIFSAHSIYYFKDHLWIKRFARIILSSFDKILSLSKQSQEEIISIGIPREKTGVFTYWVNQNTFRPQDKKLAKEELGWQKKFIVLFVSRLLEVKGIEVLLEAANILARDKNDIYFVFIGTGPLAGKIKAASRQNERVLFLGKVDNRNLKLYYNASDVTIIPSIVEEGYGRVILESLSCGTPVIGSKRGGIPEALDESVGLLIEPKTTEIVKSINYIYDHPQDLERLRSNCREYAQKRFSEDNARIIEESYEIE